MAETLNRCPVLLREVAHLDAAMAYVKSRRCAVDGGAHAGLWSERLVGLFERVVAFEPWKGHHDEFRKRVPGAELMGCALGDALGVVGVRGGADNDGQFHVDPHGATVPVFPLDDLSLEDVDFLKLDVEGYELHALRGAGQTISACRPVVLLEENGLCARYGVAPGAAGKWLQERGYRMAEVVNKDQVWVPS